MSVSMGEKVEQCPYLMLSMDMTAKCLHMLDTYQF
jgi:hypothetical protein